MGNTAFKHIFFEEIDSTSSYLIKEHNNLENFTFVSTNYQSKGKGREDRQWISAKGANLLFSFLLKDKDLIKEYSSISLCCAFVVASYFIGLGLTEIQIKWPNDVYMNGKKVAGILLEGNVEEYLVVGIGININQDKFPTNLHYPATSLYLETGVKMPINDLKESIFRTLYNELNLKNIKDRRYLKFIQKHDYLKGKDVYVNINKKRIKVQASGIAEDNSLIIDMQGYKQRVISGEIEISKGEKKEYE